MRRSRHSVMALTAALLLAGCGASPSADEELDEDALADEETRAVIVQDRFTVTRSAFGPEATLSRLLEALDRRELTVFAVIDHAAAAQSIGAELGFETVVIFGDPTAGTPLMQAVPLVGVELPLRALVYVEDDTTFLALTGASNLSRTYPLSDEAELVSRIGETLRQIADETTRA